MEYPSPNLQMYVTRPELRPTRAYPTDSGLDLHADLHEEERYILHAGFRHKFSTGVWVAVAPGWDLSVRPRSGLALKHGITVLNTPGTIDASYRGEVCVILQNLGHDPYVVKHGDRIAQMVVAPVFIGQPEFVDDLAALGNTSRGTAGYGSTG